jgi:hypothetical protein
MPASAKRRADLQHAYLVSVNADGQEVPVAVLSKRVNNDLFEALNECKYSSPPPETMKYLTVIGSRTLGISEDQRDGVQTPFATSGIALAPVVKGLVQMFRYRRRGPAR